MIPCDISPDLILALTRAAHDVSTIRTLRSATGASSRNLVSSISTLTWGCASLANSMVT